MSVEDQIEMAKEKVRGQEKRSRQRLQTQLKAQYETEKNEIFDEFAVEFERMKKEKRKLQTELRAANRVPSAVKIIDRDSRTSESEHPTKPA